MDFGGVENLFEQSNLRRDIQEYDNEHHDEALPSGGLAGVIGIRHRGP